MGWSGEGNQSEKSRGASAVGIPRLHPGSMIYIRTSQIFWIIGGGGGEELSDLREMMA